ncbi:hypothetical protein J4573_48635 [Actinomadura barringtoniae]|uniref:XRE family transcriptional regulator n=1 Tax=Actinomadura barringtoniae TaxID=1427535 RepID=A0A939PU08_9ACTN|nr:hypothetical protein [Actinomadura barringtoniae]MBO2455029.1 hypothetical protein [Actinomadura barringtoniae]
MTSDCRGKAEALRAQGFTVDQIATVFALDHPELSPLRVYRFAAGLTARDATCLCNQADPAGTASLREARLYDYEGWPTTGRRPPAWTLTLLARVYGTSARSLISDAVYGSFSADEQEVVDSAELSRVTSASPHVSMEMTREDRADAFTLPWELSPGTVSSALSPRETVDLFHALAALEADVKRRDLLFQLALAFGGGAAIPLLRHLDPAERDRLARVVTESAHVDTASVASIENLIAQCRRLNDTHGPSAVLPTVEGQRTVVAGLLRRETLLPAARDRLVLAYAELSQLAGYLNYDLLDYRTAAQKFGEGLDAALEVRDPNLIAYLHLWLASMANDQERPGIAMDHLYAAQGWLGLGTGRLGHAMHKSVSAGTLALTGDGHASDRSFDRAMDIAARARSGAEPAYFYWLSPAMIKSGGTNRVLNLKRPDAAIQAAEESLHGLGPSYRIDRGFTLTYLAEALVLKREIAAAVEKTREVAEIAADCRSERLVRNVRRTRSRLEPWADTVHVRELDEQLRTLNLQ